MPLSFCRRPPATAADSTVIELLCWAKNTDIYPEWLGEKVRLGHELANYYYYYFIIISFWASTISTPPTKKKEGRWRRKIMHPFALRFLVFFLQINSDIRWNDGDDTDQRKPLCSGTSSTNSSSLLCLSVLCENNSRPVGRRRLCTVEINKCQKTATTG